MAGKFKFPEIVVSDTPIPTPMGDYMTTKTLAEEVKKFLKENERYAGAVGGQFNYSFTDTSVELILVIEDSISKKSINVTNFGDW